MISYPAWCCMDKHVTWCQLGLQVPAASRDNSSDKLIVISGSTTSQPPTSHSNLFSPCFFLVPLWLMCLPRSMLPLRQEQLTASLAVPQVLKMTQSNRIRVCVWGGGCFSVCARRHRRCIHEVVCYFFTNLWQEGRKVQQLGWADALAAVMLWKKNKTGGWEGGIWEGDSLQAATMVNVPKAEISD